MREKYVNVRMRAVDEIRFGRMVACIMRLYLVLGV